MANTYSGDFWLEPFPDGQVSEWPFTRGCRVTDRDAAQLWVVVAELNCWLVGLNYIAG